MQQIVTRGDVSLREALKNSLNIPALKTAQAVGLPKSQAFAEGLGMTFKDGKTYESTAIGRMIVHHYK
ncbi:hypothetical protein ACT7DH_07755 [Bacillus pacificus]